MRAQWEAKDPAELLVASFNLVDVIEVGENIVSTALSVSVMDGVDASPSALLSGGVTISGSLVLQNIQGGVDGVTYSVRAVITMNTGRVLVGAATLPVRFA